MHDKGLKSGGVYISRFDNAAKGFPTMTETLFLVLGVTVDEPFGTSAKVLILSSSHPWLRPGLVKADKGSLVWDNAELLAACEPWCPL